MNVDFKICAVPFQNTILPEAVHFWERALMVRETKSTIRLNRVKSDQMKPVHGGAHAYKRRIALGTRQRRFDLKEKEREREREGERERTIAFKWGEHACNVYRSNARHDMVGRGQGLWRMIRGSFT
ncbi:Leishmanolysin-like peptidase [Cyphomyrmex costatus]|uniref:Leishmanolysin-like peptidase n=1 Tax=Cyphomyrmex costatus TaxID=456900 RepID=A0A151ICW4_9HYME|nr:Leishmanolysin-like peptidase [Cyphomyrmex costatus]